MVADTVRSLCSVAEGVSNIEADGVAEWKLLSVLDAQTVGDGVEELLAVSMCVAEKLAEEVGDHEADEESNWDKVDEEVTERESVVHSEEAALPLFEEVRLSVALSVRQLRPPKRFGHVHRQSGKVPAMAVPTPLQSWLRWQMRVSQRSPAFCSEQAHRQGWYSGAMLVARPCTQS